MRKRKQSQIIFRSWLSTDGGTIYWARHIGKGQIWREDNEFSFVNV